MFDFVIFPMVLIKNFSLRKSRVDKNMVSFLIFILKCLRNRFSVYIRNNKKYKFVVTEDSKLNQFDKWKK